MLFSKANSQRAAEASERAPQLDRREPRAKRRAATVISISAAFMLVGGALGWAGAVVFHAPEPEESNAFSTVAVVRGEVGSSIALNTVASWSTSPIALNAASGTVTSVDIEPGSLVEAGQRLYSVNLRPTVAGQGRIPAYGPIVPGDAGAQVAQLQQLLIDLGFWTGDASGTYRADFGNAVRSWQNASGAPADGVVQPGDIVWVPELPTRMSLESETIEVGRVVAAGEGGILALGEEPTFRIPLQQAQTRFAPTGTPVTVEAPDGSRWAAVAGAQAPDPNSSETIWVDLAAPDGGAVCVDRCDQVTAVGQMTLRSEIITVPVEAGLVVPVSAITTDPSGGTFVTDTSGVRRSVTVVQSARGMALIEGVDEGTEVRTPSPQEG